MYISNREVLGTLDKISLRAFLSWKGWPFLWHNILVPNTLSFKLQNGSWTCQDQVLPYYYIKRGCFSTGIVFEGGDQEKEKIRNGLQKPIRYHRAYVKGTHVPRCADELYLTGLHW